MASSSAADTDALLLGRLPTEVKAKVKYPEYVRAGCAIVRRLCDDPAAFPSVDRQTHHVAPSVSAPHTYIYRKPEKSSPTPKAPRIGFEVHVQGGGSVVPDTPGQKGVGSLVVYVASAPVGDGQQLTAKCFVRMRVKEAAVELRLRHLEEVCDFKFVHVARKIDDTILPVAPGTIVPVASPPDDGEDDFLDMIDLDELDDAIRETEELRELDHTVYHDHEPRIQALESALEGARLSAPEAGSDSPPSTEGPSPLELAVLRVLNAGGKLEKLEIRSRLMAVGFEHRDANGDVTELRAADINRALTKMKREGKVVDGDKSGARPIWSLVRS